MSNKIYYKGLDENLCGLNGYQYEVGKEYSADTDDKFHWLHFAEKVSDAFPYGPRIVEVEPLTKVNRYSAADMSAERIRILRELSADEIIDRLFEENYPLYLMDKIRPTYEQLLRHEDRIKRCDHRSILHWAWLTAEQNVCFFRKVGSGISGQRPMADHNQNTGIMNSNPLMGESYFLWVDCPYNEQNTGQMIVYFMVHIIVAILPM